MSLTRKLELRSGSPVWFAYPTRVPRPAPAPADFRTDVLVVGAGISGALIAHALTARGHAVAVLDRRGPVRGSTPASTALLQFEIDTPLVQLKRKIGARNAERAWLRSLAALGSLEALIREELIAADFAQRSSVYVAGNLLDPKELEHETRARRRIGLPGEYLGRAALKDRFGLARGGAIVSTGNAEVNPRALASALLRRARARGARLHAPFEVAQMSATRRSVLVRTRQGLEIEAKRVVLCTGYEMLEIVRVPGHRIASTWALATRAQPGRLWPERCLIWEASKPYLYLRTTGDGRVVCGGEDEEFVDEARRDAATPAKTRTLERKLARMMPAVDARAQFRWSGSFGETPDGLPVIGAVPGWPRCYAVLGYGGNGITFSMLAAQLLATAISGGRDPDADLFAFR